MTVVEVVHPALRRHRPLRARADRFDFGTLRTPVTLRDVGERPREALRVGADRVFAAEGAAWRSMKRDNGRYVTPDEFRAFLSRPVRHYVDELCPIMRWAARSPLAWVSDDRRPIRDGRVSDGERGLDPADAERASADVVAFLDDRVRIHGDRVLVREESLVGMGDFFRSAPWTSMRGENPRHLGADRYRAPALVAIRPGDLGALWAGLPGKRRGPLPTGDWGKLSGIPAELLRDDDIVWAANRLASTLLPAARGSEGGAAWGAAPLVPALEAVRRRGLTHAVAGTEVLPALLLARDAASRLSRARTEAIATRDDTAYARDPELRTWHFLADRLDRVMIPRAQGLPPGDPDPGDVETLGTLVP